MTRSGVGSARPRFGVADWLTGLRRAAFVLLLLGPHAVVAQEPTAGTVAAGLVPGQRMRVTRRVLPGDAIIPERDRQLDGRLVDIDSSSVTLRLDDGSSRRILRTDVETLELYRGRSPWRGLLAGWLVGLPIAVVACRDAKYECAEGSAIGLVSGLTGLIVGWPDWEEVRFP
ncbi:MAG: hypothetical protein JWL61_829 [Gemmatimonadetes bacterium]|nr:hypothetical protein [Gemmatimonadota bacterium]